MTQAGRHHVGLGEVVAGERVVKRHKFHLCAHGSLLPVRQ